MEINIKSMMLSILFLIISVVMIYPVFSISDSFYKHIFVLLLLLALGIGGLFGWIKPSRYNYSNSSKLGNQIRKALCFDHESDDICQNCYRNKGENDYSCYCKSCEEGLFPQESHYY